MRRLIAALTSVMILISMSACSKKKDAVATMENSATNVTVYTAQIATLEDNVTYMGEIRASQQTSVSSKVSGTAKTVLKEVGDYVNEGDVLITIDDTDYKMQYNQAKAAYNQALAQYNSITNGSLQQTKMQLESALNSAKIEYNNAKTNYENQKILYENGAISKAAFENAVTRFENAKISLDTAQNNFDITTGVVQKESEISAKATLGSASVSVQSAKNFLDNTVVRAPISGYIASKNVNSGQMVAQGVEIYSIKATESVDAHLNVTESVISKIAVGTKAVVEVKSAGIKDILGTVTNVSQTKDGMSGMYQVNVKIDNPGGALKDGMFADVKITLDDAEDAVIIPSEAIIEDKDGKKYVYVAKEKTNTAVRADVTVGIMTDENAQIISGIKEGDKVIVTGKEYLSEKNNEIRIVK